MTRLSEHFTEAEFERSATARLYGIENKIPPHHASNAKALCVNVLEKVRTYFGRLVTVTSGYRSKELNKALEKKGKNPSKTSQHCFGKAADIQIDGIDPKVIHEYIVRNLVFDQCILESDDKGAEWVHVSYVKDKNRQQSLRGVRKNGKTTYTIIDY